jgi:hypothetical protein
MKQVLSFSLLMVLLLACGDASETVVDSPVKSKPNKDTIHFYPIPTFVQEQIALLDSIPFAKTKIYSVDGVQKDSAFIQMPEFKTIAANFSQFDLNKKEVKDKMEEKLFNDETTESISMTYSTNDRTYPLQSADVLLDRESQKVKFLVLKTAEIKGDTTVLKNMQWKANKNLLISTVTKLKNGKDKTETLRVVWDN